MGILTGLIAGQMVAEEERKKKEKKEKEARESQERSWGSPKPTSPRYMKPGAWGSPQPERSTKMTTYVLGEPPRGNNEAFDALENVFGGEEFSAGDAEEVLREVLDISPSEAQNELRRLARMRAIEEA